MNGTRLLLLKVTPSTDEDGARLQRGVLQLTSEDPTLTADTDGATGHVTIGAVGELHLEIAIDRLKREFGVNAAVGRPQIGYIDAPAPGGQPPIRLEPIMRVEAIVPAHYEGAVAADVRDRRGQIESRARRGDRAIVTSIVPLAELFGYATDLRMRTRGLGTFTTAFVEYRPAPAGGDGDDGALGVRAPTPQGPRPKSQSAAVPEPDDGA